MIIRSRFLNSPHVQCNLTWKLTLKFDISPQTSQQALSQQMKKFNPLFDKEAASKNLFQEVATATT